MEELPKCFKAVKNEGIVDQADRASIAGNAIIPEGKTIPTCQNCGRELILFLQFDVEERFSLPFLPDSRFVLFACPHCNDIPRFEFFYETGFLPQNYWDITEGHFFTALYRPGQPETVLKQLPYLQPFRLSFESFGPFKKDSFLQDTIRVGGAPDWFQFPEEYTCSCGAKMEFLCEISESFGFPKRPEAPEQTNTFSEDEYCVFLGSEIYIFACPNQCHEQAIWITVQH